MQQHMHHHHNQQQPQHQRPNQHQEHSWLKVNKPDGAISSETTSMTLSPAPAYARMTTTTTTTTVTPRISGTLSVTSSASSGSSASGGSFYQQQHQLKNPHASPIISSTASQYSPTLSAFHQKPHYSTTVHSSSDIASIASDPSDITSQISVSAHRSNSLPEMTSSSSVFHSHHDTTRHRQFSQVLHAGDVVLHEKPDSNKLQLLPVKKNKKVFLVLTDTCVVYFKSAAKARAAGIQVSSTMLSSSSSGGSTKTRTSLEENNNNLPSPSVITTNGSKGALMITALNRIYAVHIVNTGAAESYTFRIEYTTDEEETKRAAAVVAQVSTFNELRQWISALRQATRDIAQEDAIVQQHHHLSPSERYATMDRIRKHNDIQDEMVMYKVVYKEKRRQSTNDLVPKDVFTTVIFAIGKYSFYLLPSASSSGTVINAIRESTHGRGNASSKLSNRKAAAAIIASASLANLERDRYGLLAISQIELLSDSKNEDDTFRLSVRQVGKPNMVIPLASTLCEDIIQKLRQAIDSLAPIRSTYKLRLPDHLINSGVVALNSASSYYYQAAVAKSANSDDPEYDEQFLQFELLLHAHCAAMNLNKSRFFYDISGPLDAKKLLLLPPNAINQSADCYSKHELIALFRSLWHNPFFKEINFAHHSLEELDLWLSNEQDGWAMHPRNTKGKTTNSVLANELYAVLVDTPSLTKLDLTDCHIGSSNHATLSPPSSLASIGIALQQKNDNGISTGGGGGVVTTRRESNYQGGGRLDRICIGKNQMSTSDIQEFVNGLHVRKGLKHLDIHDMNLHARQIEQILSTLLSYHPERLTYLDVSFTSSMPGVSPGLIEAILERCTQLKVLRLKGHRGLQFGQLVFKCQPSLMELDMSMMQHTDDDILQLTQWIRSWSCGRRNNSTTSSISNRSNSSSGSQYIGRTGSTSSSSSNKIVSNSSSSTVDSSSAPIITTASTQQEKNKNQQHVLGLDDCGLHGGHLRDIMQCIHPSGNVHVSFNGNPVLKDVVHLPKLFPVFMNGTRGPTSMALGRIEWEENSLRELFDCLRDNQTLTRLDLAQSGFVLGTGHSVSNDMVRVLTRLFERNTTLKDLSFRSSAPLLGKAITQALVGLKHNRHLERLDLTGLELGDAGIQAMADVLEHNRTLQELHIDQNMTSIQGFRAMTTAIPKSGLIELSRPYKDLRYQLQTLRDTIAGLIQSENEMQWFIIHSTQASETRRTRSQLQMQNQTRRSAEASYSKITGVVNKMMQAVEENNKRHQDEQKSMRTLQMQAEYAAEELAIAQLRLQSTSSSSSPPETPSMPPTSSSSSNSRYTYYSAVDHNIGSNAGSPILTSRSQPLPGAMSESGSGGNYHITQSPLPSPPPPWNMSPSSSASTRHQQQYHQHPNHFRDSAATMISPMTPAEYQYFNTYPETPSSTGRSCTPDEYIHHYEEAFMSTSPSARTSTSTVVSSSITQHQTPAPPRRISNNTPTATSTPAPRRPPRRRHVTEPTIDENYDHPGFIDDFGIIVRQELGSIARNQHQQRF
ncbi:hypothetical protein BDA99DRAFT_571529 [Phascolomyces articulosus]|uniref:PH domain-containing protein n=1 Tax=Phascolomyces articulosus TaxID=60185 RepID=A0AAD5KGE8_9FUNG|nr:hypothetical protein BDA99DRAFT_571529 [Phascolomyces articulosus]